MSTILQKVIPNKKVQCRIIKEGFTHSAILGQPVYLGKVVTLNASTANRFIEAGIVELVTDEKESQTESGGGDEKLSLEDALNFLKHSDKAYWTKDGKPNLNVLKELTGRAVKRDEVPENFVQDEEKAEQEKADEAVAAVLEKYSAETLEPVEGQDNDGETVFSVLDSDGKELAQGTVSELLADKPAE